MHLFRTNSSAKNASDATRLRVLAGSPHSRRGSVLVLVVGVLALLAIIIVVYTSVGQADVRGGRTMVNRARLDDQSRAIGEHIRAVIGEDATAVRVQRVYTGPGNGTYYAERETTDYPYTDPASRSMLTSNLLSQRPGTLTGDPAVEIARFSPAGNVTYTWQGANQDPRVFSDPYLATTEPTWVNRDANRLPAMPTPGALMGLHRDWGHLSLFSPSGLPVNLANLRGNFSAPSGFTAAGPYTQATTPAMSDWMYLWSRPSSNSAFTVTPNAVQVQALNGQAAIDRYNSPAVWSNDRLETFRPVTWNPSSLAIGDVKYLGNMLGDADGDGYYDALWQELVDVSDPSRPGSLLPGGTGVRWFIAPRVVDLSSMVNVNVATSFAVPPDMENPAGITPSDIDLERLLTMADARQYFGVTPNTEWINGQDYNDARRITEAGLSAFSGILEGRATGLAEVGDTRPTESSGPNIVTPPWLVGVGVQRPGAVAMLGGGAANGVLLGSVTRRQLYTLGGKDDMSGQLRVDSTGTYLKSNGGFGIGDERDLRAFGAVNDPRTTSRFETVANADFNYRLLNPLRSLRDAATDRDAGSVLPAAYVGSGVEQVPASMAQYFTDVRHVLTTLSGSRPLRASHARLTGPTDPNIFFPMSEDEVRADVTPLLRNGVAYNADAGKGIYPLSAANELFINYALALSPFLGDPDVWNDAPNGAKRAHGMSFGGPTYKTATTGTDVGETDTSAFRGRAAEVAVRTAAHLTLNLLAWQDNSKANASSTQPDNRSLAATVLLDASNRANAASAAYTTAPNSRAFPYWSPTGTTRLSDKSTTSLNWLGTGRGSFKSYTFDLDMGLPPTQSRLAGANGTNQMSTGYAVNVFAAQPQPFVTAMVVYDMYYDAPKDKGGDSMASGSGARDGEWVPILDAMGNPIGTESLGITINGDVTAINQDFIMECVAFQVTNPFDVPITLGDPAVGAAPSYYFEFGGKFYDARKYDATGPAGVITLQPRQSVCFYVLNDTPQHVQDRWTAADGAVAANALDQWLNKQLTPLATSQVQPMRTVQIDPANFNPVNANAWNEPINASATGKENKVVRLWRVVRQNSGGDATGSNDTANDFLVDRLRDPDYDTSGRAALFRRLDPGNNRFQLIDAGPEPSDIPYYTGPQSQLDNTGFAITLYGAVRRRTDPVGGPMPGDTAETTAGVMPAWCMEPKLGPGFTAAPNAKNVAEANAGIASTGSIAGVTATDFTGQPASDRTFRRMVNKGITNAAYSAAGVHPASRKRDPAAPTVAVPNEIGSDLSGVTWIAGNKATQLPVYPRRMSAPPNTEVERPPLRPGDLLMPWAIGPYQSPTLTASTYEDNIELRHTTLSEAIALGLNYAVGSSPDSYEFQIGKALDRLRLPTDRYVPYNDLNSDGEWAYFPGNPQPADPPVSNGVPFALNVLDRFRTTRYGGQTSVMQGLVNINTAPLSVLRMLPFLTPPSANIFGTDNAGFKGSWMNTTSNPFALKVKDEQGSTATRSLWRQSDDRWDAAAALVAYRDRQAVVARGPQGQETGSRVYVDFSPENDGKQTTANDFRGGRAFMNNCVNVRTEPGFRSIGEVMMAVVQDNSVRPSGQNLNPEHQKQLGIDRLAAADNTAAPSNFQTPISRISDNSTASLGVTEGTGNAREQAIGLTAMGSVRTATVGPGTHFVHGGKSADYDRKVAIANALLNCVSTRSDLFCAYFLVNGYTEGDVQGLEPWTGTGAAPTEDRFTRPLIPSVQRRYMMVLDRSQCVRPGDKPKVLMFEELPVR